MTEEKTAFPIFVPFKIGVIETVDVPKIQLEVHSMTGMN